MSAGWYEPFAATLACGLLVLDRRARPATAGGVRPGLALRILAVAGVKPGARLPLRVCDAGPWGQSWGVLRSPARCRSVAAVLRGWERDDPLDRWRTLARRAPAAQPIEATAQFLWLQARSADARPVWWNANTGWRMGTRDRDQAAQPRHRGIASTASVAARLEVIAAALERAHVDVVHGDAVAHAPRSRLDGWTAFLDAPRREGLVCAAACERRRLVAFARRLADLGARVIVAESEPIRDLDGWEQLELVPGTWVTLSFPPAWRPPVQLALVPAEELTPLPVLAPPAALPTRTPAPAPAPADQLALFAPEDAR